MRLKVRSIWIRISIKMDAGEKNLNLLLSMVADHVDLEHGHKVDEQYRKTLSFSEVDRPPLVVQAPFGSKLILPEPWNRFHFYRYRETFESPVAMLQNLLLERVVPGLLLKDDNPLAIRNNHGTVQIASILGGKWEIYEDNYPWMKPLDSIQAIEEIVYSNEGFNLDGGVLSRSIDVLEFYKKKLSEYPPCRDAIQISLPDLQGPMDTAEQLWGSSIYYAFSDTPDLLERLLAKIVEAMLVVSEIFRRHTHDRIDPFANTQHGYVIPGRLLVRDDSSIMLSPDTYEEFVRPHMARLLHEIGAGSIHFCGNGEHLISKMLKIRDLRGLDFGDGHLMDINGIYKICSEHKVVITNIRPSRDDLISGKAKRDFPTGIVFTYNPENFDDAFEVVRAYRSLM